MECRHGKFQSVITRGAPIAGLGAALIFASPIGAQVPSTDSAASPRVGIGAGVGLIASSSTGMAGYKMDLSLGLPQRHAVIVRYTKAQEYCLFDTCAIPERAAEVAVMYGWMPNTRYGGATIAAGAALLTSLTADRTGFGVRSRQTNPAIPIEIASYVQPDPAFAVGLSATADLTPDHSIAGLFLTVRLSFD